MPIIKYADLLALQGGEIIAVGEQGWIAIETSGFIFFSNVLDIAILEEYGLAEAIKDAEETTVGEYSGYKLRVNINPDDIPQACELIIDMFSQVTFPVIIKMTHPRDIKDIDCFCEDDRRLIETGQFTIYIFDPETIAGNIITREAQLAFYLSIRRAISQCLDESGIRASNPPCTDFIVDRYMSGRVDRLSPRNICIKCIRFFQPESTTPKTYLSPDKWIDRKLIRFHNERVRLFRLLKQDAHVDVPSMALTF